jgi:hypothetical protein
MTTIWSKIKLGLFEVLVIMLSGLPLVWLRYRRLFSIRTPKDLLQSTTCLQEVSALETVHNTFLY